MKLIIFFICALSSMFLECAIANPIGKQCKEYLDTVPIVLQYRQAYYEIHGHIAPGSALPITHAWPLPEQGFSYKGKLTHLLPLATGVGAEIGPLNIPILSKSECKILYVDHLDTEGLRKKYPDVQNIVSVDRPMVNNSLKDTLVRDAPLDYMLASQVLEHVPNPIQWLREIASVLRDGGLLAISLPDRRVTFDMFREETRAADIVLAYFEETVIPDVRCIYDQFTLVAPINLHWIMPNSLYPRDVIGGRGSATFEKLHERPLDSVRSASHGKYLDAHCWVFTPPSFLLVMAQLAGDGFLPFKCRQFYPTEMTSDDRCNSSFIIILEKVGSNITNDEIRRSFLMPLGEQKQTPYLMER